MVTAALPAPRETGASHEGNMDEETTNPAETETVDAEVEAEVQETEPQFDDDGNPIEDQAEDEEEIDLDDESKLKLPKSLAEKVRKGLMLNADYTRKTQELAEQRKAFETERQAITQADEHEINARGNLAMLDQQIAQYAKVDWRAWNDNDPFEAQKAFQQYQLLKDAKTETTNYLSALRTERTSKEQQETAKRLEEGRSTIVSHIPEWSPTYSAKLFSDAQKIFGLTSSDLEGIDDPRVIIVLDAAVRGKASQTGQKKAQTIQQAAKVVPAAKAASGSSAPASEPKNTDAWMKWREKQVQKRA